MTLAVLLVLFILQTQAIQVCDHNCKCISRTIGLSVVAMQYCPGVSLVGLEGDELNVAVDAVNSVVYSGSTGCALPSSPLLSFPDFPCILTASRLLYR